MMRHGERLPGRPGQPFPSRVIATLRRHLGWAATAVVVVVLIFVFFATRNSIVRNPSGPVLEAGSPAFDPIRADEIQSILPEDAIPAIVNPTYKTVAAASDFRNDEQVIGVVVNGDARAFPLSTLSAHEIVNDTIGGKPVAVTW